MKNIKAIKLVIIAVAILISSPGISQGIKLRTDDIKYQAFDKLFKLKWKTVDKNFSRGKLLINNGLVFCTGVYSYCLEGKTGDTLNFSDQNDRLKIRKYLHDSILIVLNVLERVEKIINVFTGEEVISAGFSGYRPYLLDSKFIKDSIYYYPISKGLIIMAKDLKRPSRVLWKYPTESEIIYKYLRFDSLCVVFTQQKLILLNGKTGIREWESSVKRLVSDPILIDNDFYFITAATDKVNTLYSFNLHERKMNWSIDFASTCGYYGLAVDKGKACYISGKGVHIMDAKTGKELFLAKGWYDETVISIIDDYIIVYDKNLESISIGTGIGLNTGKIEYQYFTSDGFPPLGEDDMSELGKEMKAKGEADWWEGLGYNYLDGTDVFFTKDNSTGLIYANGGGIVYCLEYIKK